MQSSSSKKTYVVMVGSAPMASFDALMLSLERFEKMLSSDSATSRFETTIRSIQPSLAAVDSFIESVYAEKSPTMSVTMTGRSLIIELSLTKDEFLNLINEGSIKKILTHVIAVGSMPAKKSAGQATREYISFPVKYQNNKFTKVAQV